MLGINTGTPQAHRVCVDPHHGHKLDPCRHVESLVDLFVRDSCVHLTASVIYDFLPDIVSNRSG